MVKPNKNKISSPAEIMDIIFSFRKSRIILTAFEFDLFSAIGNNKVTSEEVAKTIGADTRGTDRLMNALCVMGLFKKEKDLFSNSILAKKYLIKSSVDFLAGIAHSSALWSTWSTLTQAVQKGGSVIERSQSVSNNTQIKGFIAAMHQRARIQAKTTTLLLDLTHVATVLDIGGGSGAYSMAILTTKRSCRGTIFDLPNVIPITKSYIEKAGMLSRFDFIPGDFNKDDFGSGYDLILLSAIIHMNSVEKNINLLKKASNSLNKGGQLVIQDFIMNKNRTKPDAGAFFSLNMLVNTDAGDTFTEQEIREWMKAAGLYNIKLKKTPFEGLSLIIGWK